VDDGQPNDGSKLHCATKRLWAISWPAEDFNGAELQPQRTYGNGEVGDIQGHQPSEKEAARTGRCRLRPLAPR